jgi:hypothetical protein
MNATVELQANTELPAEPPLKPKRIKKHGETLPVRFRPRFWTDSDQRCAGIRAVQQRMEQLRTDSNADSMQKELIVQRAGFVSVLLESMELNHLDGTCEVDGRYAHLSNSLVGLLKSLGIEKQAKRVGLAQYLEGKR